MLSFYSINYRFTPLLKDLRRAGVPYVLTEQGQLAFQDAARWLKKFIYLNCLDWGPRRAAVLAWRSARGKGNCEGADFVRPKRRQKCGDALEFAVNCREK